MFKIPDWDDDTQGNKVGNILKVLVSRNPFLNHIK